MEKRSAIRAKEEEDNYINNELTRVQLETEQTSDYSKGHLNSTLIELITMYLSTQLKIGKFGSPPPKKNVLIAVLLIFDAIGTNKFADLYSNWLFNFCKCWFYNIE